MAEQHSPELDFNLLSKSSPSQFNINNNRSRIPSSSENNFYSKLATVNNKGSNLSHVPCKFYKQGTCTAGANCTFSHSSDLSSQAAVCKYYLKGNCKFGTKCALLHTMSAFNNNNNNNNKNRFIAMTPPNQSTTLLDYQPMLSPPNINGFGTSAPAGFFIHDLWRNNGSSNFGLHSSPRESSSSMDYLLGTSPFSNNPSRLSSSFKQQRTFDNDMNDILLPSSLNNDLFTPVELQQRSTRQRQQPEAINIPNHPFIENYSHHSSISSTSSQQKKLQSTIEDDEVQFYMEDDEALTLDDHKIDNIITTPQKNHFSSLYTLP